MTIGGEENTHGSSAVVGTPAIFTPSSSVHAIRVPSWEKVTSRALPAAGMKQSTAAGKVAGVSMPLIAMTATFCVARPLPVSSRPMSLPVAATSARCSSRPEPAVSMMVFQVVENGLLESAACTLTRLPFAATTRRPTVVGHV